MGKRDTPQGLGVDPNGNTKDNRVEAVSVCDSGDWGRKLRRTVQTWDWDRSVDGGGTAPQTEIDTKEQTGWGSRQFLTGR